MIVIVLLMLLCRLSSVYAIVEILSAINPIICIQPVSMDNGAHLVVAKCDGTSHQQWTLTGNRISLANNKCLDMTNGNNNDGNKPQIWDCFDDNVNQAWSYQGGKIMHATMCLDMTDGNSNAGTVLQVWTCYDNNQNQIWKTQQVQISSPAATPASGNVHVWMSSADLSTHLQQQDDLQLSGNNSSNALTLTVDSSQKRQPLEGFGASLTDSSAYLINQKMSATQVKTLMTQLFDPVQGIGLSVLRQPMGASDFSHVGSYTYDDGPSDPSLANFSIAYDQTDIIPLLKMAVGMNPALKIIAVPWSPPAWMKTSNALNGGSLRGEAFDPLARYFVKFIQAYAAQGVPIWAVSPQNEPQYSSGSYPTMTLSATDAISFIRDYLAPAFAHAGITTKIFGFDHNVCDENSNQCPATYPAILLADQATAAAISGIAWHCYNGDFTHITAFHDSYPNVPLYLTECSGGSWQNGNPSFLDAEMWLIFRIMNNWMRSAITWNLALDSSSGPTNGDCVNCRGVVTIDPSSGAVTYNAEFYAMGHLSKFWRPGAYVIAVNSRISNLNTAAYQNVDGLNVLLVQNTGSSSTTFWIKGNSSGFSATVPAGATITYLWK